MATDVPGIIERAQETATTMASDASAMLAAATGAFDTRYEIIPGNIPVSFKDVSFNPGLVPTYSGAHFTRPSAPGAAPSTLPLPTTLTDAMPSNSAAKPTYVDPTTPSALDTFSVATPTLSDLTVPPAPSALSSLNITPPTLSTIVVPAAPVVPVPSFDAVRPTTTLSDPGDMTAQFRQDFSDQGATLRSALSGEIDAYMSKLNPQFASQMAAIEGRLSKFLAGGSGLTPAVENAIYARAQDKTNDEYMRTRDTIYQEAASRGFTMPSGSTMSALFQARQAAADNNARAAMDIAIKQAELEQDNLKFAVTQSTQLRQIVINAAQQWAGNLVQINAQALQFAQGVLQAAVDLYEIRVKIVASQVEVYKAEAQVYEYRLKAALAVYDVYQAQIQGLKAQVDVDTAKVQAFTAQANAYGALANAYKAAVDGVATKAQIEKLKVDVFGAQVQAYSARVAGKTAEWQGFRAQVEGQAAKVDAYKTEVQAYGQEVEAYKAKVQARSVEIQAVGQANESAARTYTAAVQAYTALVQGESAAVTAEINSFESTLKAYTAGVQTQEAVARLAMTNSASKAQVAVSAYAQQAQVVISNAQMNYKRMNDMASVATQGANVYAHMASSALAGVTAIAEKSEQYNF